MSTADEVKSRLDIVNIIGEYVALKKAGNNYKGLCPFHKEATPSFMVSQQLQIYKCFGCGEGGDIFTFTQKMEGYDFKQALITLAQKAGVEIKNTSYSEESVEGNKKVLFEINDLACRFYTHLLLKHKAGEEGLAYVTKARKLTIETATKWRLGYAPDGWEYLHKFLLSKGYSDKDMLRAGVVVPNKNNTRVYDKFRGRLIFPLISHDGKLLGFGGRTIIEAEPKYLNTQETSIFHKENFLYGLNINKLDVRESGAVIVEGYMDVVSAYQNGIQNTVASCGTSLTLSQLKIVSRYTKDITLCFDSDSAGVQASIRGTLLAETLNLNPKVAVIPIPYKDLDDIAKADVLKAKKVLGNSQNAYDFILATVFKKHDKNSSLGKKKAMEELVQYFSEVRNSVILDHYSKLIAQELELEFEIVQQALLKKTVDNAEEPAFSEVQKALSLEEYALALLLTSSKLDKSNVLLQNLCPEDFRESTNASLFQLIKELAEKSKEIDLKKLEKMAPNGDISVKMRELSLLEITGVEGQILQEKEAEKVAKRIKKDANKRMAQELTKKIKEAERNQNEIDLKKLIKEFNKLPKDL